MLDVQITDARDKTLKSLKFQNSRLIFNEKAAMSYKEIKKSKLIIPSRLSQFDVKVQRINLPNIEN